jgi:hypothetical protein
MLYWEQIKRFRQRDNIHDEWHGEPVVDDMSLDDLGEMRLRQQARQTERKDPDTNTMQTVTEREPWVMPPTQALKVYDKLDECANVLGFDAEPVEVRKKFGYQRVDADDLDDDPDKFSPQPVEVPGDD